MMILLYQTSALTLLLPCTDIVGKIILKNTGPELVFLRSPSGCCKADFVDGLDDDDDDANRHAVTPLCPVYCSVTRLNK